MEKPVIKIIEGFIDNPDEMFGIIRDRVKWDERMKARKTASFGVSYDYSGMSYPRTEMPAYLIPVCKQIGEIIGFVPNNCLLNFYPDGVSTMGFHSDSTEELMPGTGVAILSLGAERHIVYRNKADKTLKFKYLLKAAVLLYMSDEVQQHWMHAIPKEAGAGERISLTFRHVIR